MASTSHFGMNGMGLPRFLRKWRPALLDSPTFSRSTMNIEFFSPTDFLRTWAPDALEHPGRAVVPRPHLPFQYLANDTAQWLEGLHSQLLDLVFLQCPSV